ncbi:sigma 54-interacting transcriptional regulator, partial [Desulforhopalus singaporensis]
AAQTDSPVLLSGETGTGKELFAQAIHNLSKRKKARYIAVNCAAIPENLLEGILFGTSRGAFTGALDKPGLFERAHGGTIFLDEINSMSQEMQPKLLRAIQEKKICRVGSHKEMRLNVKIISSLNKDIEQTFLSGEVRRDLLYRLSVVCIALPPLRERKGDIVLLSDHFLAKHSAIMHKNVSGISTEVMDLFEHHNWPGNVRELEHVIEGALNMIGRDRTLEKWHLNSNIDLEMQKPIPRATAVSLESSPSLQGRLYSGQPDDKANERSDQVGREGEGTEKQQILEALYDTDGNISDAAMLMGVSRKTLYRKLKSCNIVIPPQKTSTLDRREIVEKLYQYGGNVTHTAKALGISRQLLAYKLKKMKIERP